MTKSQAKWFVWVQPLDPTASDEMSLCGRSLSEGDGEERRKWIGVVDSSVKSARRPFPGGGFAGRARMIAVGEIPLTPPANGVVHTAVVALSRRRWGSLDVENVLEDVAAVSARAGYGVAPAVLRDGLWKLADLAKPSRLVGRRAR